MAETTAPLRDSYEGILERARQTARAGDASAAIELYRRLIAKLSRLSDRILARRPELRELHVEARQELVELLELAGRYAEALEITEPLLELAPERSDEWRRLMAIQRVSKGQVEQGLSELQSLAQDAPDDIWHWIVLGREARIAGRLEESRQALERGLQVVDSAELEARAFFYAERFHLFKAMGRLDEAAAAWERATDLAPELGFSVKQVYEMFTKSGRYNRALEYVARDQNEMQAGFQRGLIATLTGRPGEARAEWQAVAALDPLAYDFGHDAWAEAVLRLGAPDPALEKLRPLLAKHGTWRLLVLSGIAWAMKGDGALASALFQRAINTTRHHRPPKQKLASDDWRLLDSVVDDDEIKSVLRPYFAVVETLWASAGEEVQPATILRP